MALPTLRKNPSQVKTGPGTIWLAPIGTTIPTWTVAASKFTNVFPAGWVSPGYTEEGLTLTFGRETGDVPVAEEFYPIRKVTTSVNGSAAFTMAGLSENNLAFALNGGTWTVVSGTTATTLKKYAPPAPGAETRCMLAHISADSDEIFIAYQTYQTGEITRAFQKGSSKASLSGLSFQFEVPDTTVSSDVWNYFTAGTWTVDV